MVKRGGWAMGVRFSVAAALALLVVGAPHVAAAEGAADDAEPARANPYVLHIPVCTATDVMIADLDQIDAEKGLSRGGAAVTAIEEAIRTSGAAPNKGVADLELVVRRDGSQSLTVLWAARERSDWEGFTRGVEHLVTSSDVRIPERSLGMKIVLRVEARLVYADGCPIGDRSSPEPFTGGYARGCGTRPIPAPEQGVTCGRRRRGTEQPARVVHARILSQARIPDPVQPTQRTRT